MAKKIGRLINLGIGREDTRGVPETAQHWLPKTSISFADKAEKALSEVGYGSIGESNQELVALKWAEGDIEFDLVSESFGLIALATFGTVSSASYETSAYKHTFSLQNDNSHDSLTFYVNDEAEGIDLYFSMVMLNELTINIVPEEVIKATAGFISKSSGGSSALSSSYAAESKFVGRHATIKIAATTGALTASSKVNLKEMELTISKNVVRDHALSTVQAIDINNQKFQITGTLTLDLQDNTYRDYVLDGDYKALRLDIVNSDVTIGSAGNPSFRIDLSRVAFDTWEPERPNDDIATQTINFKALYDITNGDIIHDCYLTNTTADYDN